MSARRWDERCIADQRDRVAIVTGANSGLGFATALALARGHAKVVLACRDEKRAEQAAAAIAEKTGRRDVETLKLSLDSLASVHAAADAALSRYPRIDLLINNAGVMCGTSAQSTDGLELHAAVNYLGHFAWTARLLPRVLSTPGSRIVGLGSLGHYAARTLPHDWLRPTAALAPFQAYARSKLAVLAFTVELQARLTAARVETKAMAAHPGGARTELIRSSVGGMRPSWARHLLQFQNAQTGALPILRAALDECAAGGCYYGPSGPLQLWGRPVPVRMSSRSRDPELRSRLWRDSELITGLRISI